MLSGINNHIRINNAVFQLLKGGGVQFFKDKAGTVVLEAAKENQEVRVEFLSCNFRKL